MVLASTPSLPLDQFLLLVRLALVALLYIVILQVVGVARRDMRRLSVAPAGATHWQPVVGHPAGVDTGIASVLPGPKPEGTALPPIGRAPTTRIGLPRTLPSPAQPRRARR